MVRGIVVLLVVAWGLAGCLDEQPVAGHDERPTAAQPEDRGARGDGAAPEQPPAGDGPEADAAGEEEVRSPTRMELAIDRDGLVPLGACAIFECAALSKPWDEIRHAAPPDAQTASYSAVYTWEAASPATERLQVDLQIVYGSGGGTTVRSVGSFEGPSPLRVEAAELELERDTISLRILVDQDVLPGATDIKAQPIDQSFHVEGTLHWKA